MFVDEATVYVKAGNGGDGLVAFRREKYVPRGGPSGGDGGAGGSVIFAVEPGLRTLLDFKYRQHFVAENGRPGGPSKRSGRGGEDLIVPVPEGTVVRDAADGRLIADLAGPEQRAVIARGGRGGRGNARFATSTEQTPTFAEKGEPGAELRVHLELKLIADAGLIGMPNAGKSTFLSRVSAARPKIADYPFTTLVPNLGVVAAPGREGESFVLADIPGLISGAHAGSGLGDRFLRHVERTRVLVHLIDVSDAAGRDPGAVYRDVREELALYDPVLAAKPELIVATKMDLPGAEEGARRLEAYLRRQGDGRTVYRASPLTGEGLTAVLYAVADELAHARAGEPPHAAAGQPVRAAAGSLSVRAAVGGALEVPASRETEGPSARARGFTVERRGDAFVVRGEDVERLVVMTDLDHEAAVRRLHSRLKRRGLIRALRAAGARAGSTVKIGDYEFEFVD